MPATSGHVPTRSTSAPASFSDAFRALVLIASVLAMSAASVQAKVLLAKDEALALAFPDVERIEERVVILTDAQKATVEKLSKAPLETQLWTIHVGWRGGAPVGYAILDTHVVRTLPETCMTVIAPDGEVKRVEIIAFHEPPEYAPTDRWMRQFDGQRLDDDLRLRGDIQGITGATLTAVATTAAARRALALFQVVIGTSTRDAQAAPATPPTPGER